MTLREAKREFICNYYKTQDAYRRARKADYCQVQFEWSCYMDSLCKDGLITQKQWERATF